MPKLTKKRWIITGLVIVVAIVMALAYRKQWSVEYERLLNGNAEISSIIFSGGGKRIEVKDQDVIHDFEEALVNGWGKEFQTTGISQEVKFIFKSGIQISTELYLYEDKSGFQMADYSDIRTIVIPLTDPRYVNAEFKPNIHQKTKDLISKLMQPTQNLPMGHQTLETR